MSDPEVTLGGETVPAPDRRRERPSPRDRAGSAAAEAGGSWTDAERRASIAAALALGPGGDVWIFAYGSLIWKPLCDYAEGRTGFVHGWHRSFCLRTTHWRGTPDRPGLMLALDRGGRCSGMAYRLQPQGIEDRLAALWRREMGAKPANQRPRWVKVETAAGPLRALAFVADRDSRAYVGGQSSEDIAAVLAVAGGVWGTCAEYLDRTVSHLEILGIADASLKRLREMVARTAAPVSPLPLAPFSSSCGSSRTCVISPDREYA